MATKIKRRPSADAWVIIHNRRFYWRYPDGAMRPVVLSERAKAHLWQAKATVAREQADA
jgi:hypothetical protein